MKRISILIITLISLTTYVNAQASISEKTRIDSLLQLHIAYNTAVPVIPGYRIQLFMESGNTALEKAEKIKEKFIVKHKSTPSYITFGEPYYRVRIGDFRTRLEAVKFLDKIQRSYPQAWVVKDKINFPESSKNQKNRGYE